MTPEDKRARALELRLAGATYADIARAVGYADRSGARQAVQQAMAENPPDRDQVTALDTELARLDAMLTGLWPKARRGDYAAVDRVMAIDRRIAELLGEETVASRMPKETTSLSDFEKRLAERRKRATRHSGGTQSG
jgi:transposase-like protein